MGYYYRATASSLNLVEVGNKAKSKCELYHLLTVEGGLYFLPENQTNMEFISDVFFDEKKVRNLFLLALLFQIKALLSKDVTVCQIPHVDGLHSSDLIKFIVEDCEDFLPKNYIDNMPNRAWLANICHALDSEKLQDMVKFVLKNRESKMVKRNNQCFQVNPKRAEIIISFQMVSVSKGRSNYLLKKKLLKDEKEIRNRAEEKKELAINSIAPMRKEIQELKMDLSEKERELECYSKDSDLLHSLFGRGVIDIDGNPK